MKKFFTLVALATMAIAANAQTESAFTDKNAYTYEMVDDGKGGQKEQTNIIAGHVFSQSAHVKHFCQADFGYNPVEMYGEADKFNTVTIDGVAYPMTPALQANGGNGKDCNTDHTAPQSVGGSEQFYECTGTGYLYVFSKTSNNKKYYVWEGDFVNDGSATTLAYTHFMGDQGSGTNYSYTLPADEQGYVAWPAADATYPTEYFLSNKAYNQPNAMPNCSAIGASLGVIAFPVFGTAESPMIYSVYASGSKITTNGFVFVPAENPTLAGLSTPTFSKDEPGTGIANVEAVENAKAAPVKVIKNGQIMIGDFNIAGQRVK